MAALEENLYAGTFDDVEADMYPAAFVVLTSVLGVCMVRKLQHSGRLRVAVSWLLQCIYVAKLSMLAIPEVLLLIFLLITHVPLTLVLICWPLDTRSVGRPSLPLARLYHIAD